MENNKKKKAYKIKKRKRSSLESVLSVILCLETILLGYVFYPLITRKSEHIKTLDRIEASINVDEDTVYRRFLIAVKCNGNLTTTEKEYIINALDTIVAYKNYIDLDYLEEILLTLKISYSNKNEKGNKKTYIKGEYSNYKNKITFYGIDNIEEIDLPTFNHELFHAIQKEYYKERNEYLIETVNTIFNEDNTEMKEITMYSCYYNYTKMLMEIIGVEPFCKFQGYSTSEPIVKELSKIYGTDKEAEQLLADMDVYKYYFDKFASEGSLDRERNIARLDELNKHIIEQIGIYYEIKYGFTMDNDLIMLYYYDYDKFCSEIDNKFYVDGNIQEISEENYLTYFKNRESSSLVVNSSGLIKTIYITVRKVNYSDCNEEVEEAYLKFVIDDSNRYINNVSMILHQ